MTKRKRQELDLHEQRFEVRVTFKQKNLLVSARKIAEKFQCGKTQINSILLKKDEIIEDYEANVSNSIKLLRTAQHEDIDNALLPIFQIWQCK